MIKIFIFLDEDIHLSDDRVDKDIHRKEDDEIYDQDEFFQIYVDIIIDFEKIYNEIDGVNEIINQKMV